MKLIVSCFVLVSFGMELFGMELILSCFVLVAFGMELIMLFWLSFCVFLCFRLTWNWFCCFGFRLALCFLFSFGMDFVVDCGSWLVVAFGEGEEQ